VGLPAHRYHEELATGVRAGEQLQFSMPGERAILVATSAFAPGTPQPADDAEGVPLRYGRRTRKNDIRSLVRFQPPASPEQLVDELALIGRDGERAEAVVFHDPSDRPAIEAELEGSRPTGAQLLLLGRAFENTSAEAAVMTEALALAARSTLRTIEALGKLLDGMGLVSQRDGWLRRIAPEQVLLRELRSLAERFATVRALDGRRLGEMSELCLRGGCFTAGLRRALGDPAANPCGVCSACTDGRGAPAPAPGAEATAPRERHSPPRRFTVATVEAGDTASARTFRSDSPGRQGVLTAKLADFK
jgi:ATP-dependent DNA helicase RecQ